MFIYNYISTVFNSIHKLSVRQIKAEDFEKIIDYFLEADKSFLLGMGVDSSKLTSKKKWLGILCEEYQKSIEKKSSFYVVWILDNEPVGHSNINNIVYGEEAHMHLHLWKPCARKKGIGLEFIKMSIPHYFGNFKLKKLYCEPYALNPSPNKILRKLGFDFIKEYDTTPGWINFYQPVNKWCMDSEKYKSLFA